MHVAFVLDKVTWHRFLSEFFGFPCQYHPIMPPWLSTIMYHLVNEQEPRWWPQFRDIVSHNRDEQEHCKNGKTINN
jgi:hypothetical protein